MARAKKGEKTKLNVDINQVFGTNLDFTKMTVADLKEFHNICTTEGELARRVGLSKGVQLVRGIFS